MYRLKGDLMVLVQLYSLKAKTMNRQNLRPYCPTEISKSVIKYTSGVWGSLFFRPYLLKLMFSANS